MSDALNKINHIVVLMLENRSFDHMLGYLRLEQNRQDIDGLTGNETNNDLQGNPHSPKLLSETSFAPDPNHDWSGVEEQLSNNNSGFIKNFALTHPGVPKPQRIIHYHNGKQLPIFNHLAEEFCVCDRWFSSVPGATQPNRMYALGGHCSGRKNNLSAGQLLGGWDVRPIFEFLPSNVSWRWYSHDIATLRFARGYQALVPQIDKISEFYKRARKGKLHNVSWIDPDFSIPPFFYPGPPNDDHPPHDVSNGQNLVRRVYNALLTGPKAQWQRTLLIVVYDEHGGFYDHVSPTNWQPADDHPDFRRYGVRVPAFVISPWVSRRIAYGSQTHHLDAGKVIFDHTSILRTILRRFCTPQGGAAPHVSARVSGANDLGALLTETKARTDCTPAPDLPFKIAWKDRFMVVESADTAEPGILVIPRPPSELQQSLEALAEKALKSGVPPEKL